jgi:hypothetical protein
MMPKDLTKWLSEVFSSELYRPVDPNLDKIELLKLADANMKRELGPVLYDKVERASKTFVNAMDGKLQEAVDAGMMDPALLKKLRTEYPWYHPTYYLDHLEDALNGFDEFIPSGYGSAVDSTGNLVNSFSDKGRDLPRAEPIMAFISYMARMKIY